MIDPKTTQEAFLIIERLAAVTATSSISEETRKVADEQIKKLIEGPIKTSVTSLGGKAAGIVGV